MKQRDPAGGPRRSGKPAIAAPRKLLAAVSLLGASLGVSAAAPADSISGSEPRSADAAVRLAETKPVNQGSTKSMGWDVRTSQSNQKKEAVSQSNQWKIRSNQKKETNLQSNQKKEIQIRSDQKKGSLPAMQ